MTEPRPSPRSLGLRWRLTLAFVLVAVAAAGLVALLGRRAVHLEIARLETERSRQPLEEVTPAELARVGRALEAHRRRHGDWSRLENDGTVADLLARGKRLVILPAANPPARHSPELPLARDSSILTYLSPTGGELRAETTAEGWRYLETYEQGSGEGRRGEEQILFQVDHPPTFLRDEADRPVARFHLLPPLPGERILGVEKEEGVTVPLRQRFRLGVDEGLAWAFALAVLLALAAALALAGPMVRPLERLTAVAQRMAEGDLAVRVEPPRRRDEIHRLARAFNTMAASLEALEASRRRLVADVAHELRTPLTHLQGRLEALQDGLLQPDDALFATLHGDTLVLSRLLDDLQDLAQMEAGVVELDPQDVDLEAVARKAAAGFTTEGPRLDLELAGAPRVSADPLRLEQILRNLLANAHRHTPAGGTIRVLAREGKPEWVEVRVEDTGEGIPPTEIPRVFDRFHRADPARRRDTGGSGLGLAIVRQLVDAHGGTVTAESPIHADSETSEDLPGTRILFTLPKSTPKW